MNKLLDQIDFLETLIPQGEQIKTSVSQRGVDWHIEHSLNVIVGICTILQSQTALQIKGNISLLGRFVMVTGFIPKGRGKAPKAVNNLEKVDLEKLAGLVSEVKIQLKKAKEVPEHASYDHPYFKILKKKRALRFLEIHTHHHTKIINDILKK